MKKTIRFIVMVVAVSLSATLLLMVGCKKREAPSCPYSASATVSANTIRLSWTSVENADFYVITDGYGSYLDEIYGTSYTDYYPSEGYNYYRVYSENQYGRSSSYASASCYYEGDGGGSGGGTGSAPSAPTGVSAEISGSRVCVTWNGVSNASYYRVYRASSSSGSYSMLETSSNTYYYDASPNTYNYYKVTAVNSSGTESEKSDYAYCYYSNGGGGGGGGSAPSAPTGVTAEVSGSKIRVSWNSVSNADEYYVYWSSSGSSYEKIGTTYNTYYNDNNPSSDNYYKIKAKNSNGTSSYSSYAYCHYSSGGGGGGGGGGNTNYKPCPPTVSASGSTSSISVSWTKTTGTGCGNPTSYKVYKRNPVSNSYEFKTTTTSTSYRDTDVHPGINRYAVEAINDYGSSEGYGYSSEIPLSKPSSFSAQKSGNDRINFSWSKVSQATGYDIFISTSSYGNYTTFQSTEDNVTSLNVYYPGESGHTYYFKIRAYWRYGYGQYIFSDFTTYKSVTF